MRLCWSLALLVALTGVGLFGCGGGSGGGDGTFTVTGVVVAAANSIVDSDVNDPSAPFTSNSDFSSAQPIPNPVVVGGYVNIASFGPPGRSLRSGDQSDFFATSLEAGQSVVLTISTPATDRFGGPQNDLDLYLYRAGDQTVLDSSQSYGGLAEYLTIAEDGAYVIEVRAKLGASGYTLQITRDALSLAEQPALRLSDDFVPGEIVVRFTDPDAAEISPPSAERKLPPGLVKKAGRAGTALLVLDDELPLETKDKAKDAKDQRKLATLEAIKALRRQGDVLWAEPNYRREGVLVPNDSYYRRQWHYETIGLPQAWPVSTGSDVIVAVIDSGVLPGHPDLLGKLLPGYDLISDSTNAADGDGLDSSPIDPGHPGVGGSSFHGTHVAGTVAAATNNGSGVAGVAWSAKIMPLRVLGSYGATSYDICQALRFAAGLANDSGVVPARRADVANLSIGGKDFSQAEQACVDDVRAAGLAVIAAAGNGATDSPLYPAAYDGVVSVGAVDMSRRQTWYSNYGPTLDLVAPGGDTRVDVDGDGNPDGVLSTAADDSGGFLRYTYAYYMGTSMAAPHVAGVYALMKAVYPALSPRGFDNLLVSGALTEDLGASGRENMFGYGLINAPRAVAAAVEQAGGIPVSQTPYAVLSPPGLNFGQSAAQLSVRLDNAGEAPLQVSAVTEDSAGWLSVASAEVGADGLGRYLVTVDRTGLSVGTYTATVTFTSSANVARLPVIMQVGDRGVNADADAGLQYIVLVRAGAGLPSRVAAVKAERGQYRYTLTDVPPGEYEVYAGSDLDDDGRICERGESCGAYNTFIRPIVIQVSDSSLSGIDFVTGFGGDFAAQAAAVSDAVRATAPLSRLTTEAQ